MGLDLASGRLPLTSITRIRPLAKRRMQGMRVLDAPLLTRRTRTARQRWPRRTWITTREPCGAPLATITRRHLPFAAPFAAIVTAGPRFLASPQETERSMAAAATREAMISGRKTPPG